MAEHHDAPINESGFYKNIKPERSYPLKDPGIWAPNLCEDKLMEKLEQILPGTLVKGIEPDAVTITRVKWQGEFRSFRTIQRFDEPARQPVFSIVGMNRILR